MAESTVYSVLVICCISHFLNDMIQSIIPSIYPILKDKFDFSFAQIGIITLVFQMTSSILQPFTGLSADRHPRPMRSPSACASRSPDCSCLRSPRTICSYCWL